MEIEKEINFGAVMRFAYACHRREARETQGPRFSPSPSYNFRRTSTATHARVTLAGILEPRLADEQTSAVFFFM